MSHNQNEMWCVTIWRQYCLLFFNRSIQKNKGKTENINTHTHVQCHEFSGAKKVKNRQSHNVWRVRSEYGHTIVIKHDKHHFGRNLYCMNRTDSDYTLYSQSSAYSLSEKNRNRSMIHDKHLSALFKRKSSNVAWLGPCFNFIEAHP